MAGLKVQPVNLFPEHLQRVGSLQFEAIVTNIRKEEKRGEEKRREEKRKEKKRRRRKETKGRSIRWSEDVVFY